jgi:hypothetical protein
VPVATWSPIPVGEKRQALELVLQSRVFLRCDQLKRMLRFICEAEIDGRAEELSEYIIGVEALGRAPSYNPVEDSTVRTRAYELRHKLKRFYSTEAPDAPIHIEIEKGAYVPRFIRTQEQPIRAQAAGAAAEPEAPRRAGRRWLLGILAAANCVVLILAAYVLLRMPRAARAPQAASWTPEMEAFWKPFLNDDTPLLLTYQTRLFLFAQPLDLVVRHWHTNDLSEVPASEPLMRLQKQMGIKEFTESRNYTDFGTVNSVFVLMQTVGQRQHRISLKGSKDLGWNDISNNNLIFIGQADVHPGLKRVLEAGDFVEEVQGIRNLHPKPGEQTLYPVAQMGSNDGDKYALLSRFPGPQRGRYVLILGAAHSELPWALSEYVTNPLTIHELVEHLRLPSGEIPDAFQLILRVTLQSQVPVRIRYATHHVVAAPEFPPDAAPRGK